MIDHHLDAAWRKVGVTSELDLRCCGMAKAMCQFVDYRLSKRYCTNYIFHQAGSGGKAKVSVDRSHGDE